MCSRSASLSPAGGRYICSCTRTFTTAVWSPLVKHSCNSPFYVDSLFLYLDFFNICSEAVCHTNIFSYMFSFILSLETVMNGYTKKCLSLFFVWLHVREKKWAKCPEDPLFTCNTDKSVISKQIFSSSVESQHDKAPNHIIQHNELQ